MEGGWAREERRVGVARRDWRSERMEGREREGGGAIRGEDEAGRYLVGGEAVRALGPRVDSFGRFRRAEGAEVGEQGGVKEERPRGSARVERSRRRRWQSICC